MEFVYSAENIRRVDSNDAILSSIATRENSVKELLTINGDVYQRSRNVRFDDCLQVHRLSDGSLSKESVIVSGPNYRTPVADSSIEDLTNDLMISSLNSISMVNAGIIVEDKQSGYVEFWEPYNEQDVESTSALRIIELSDGSPREMVTAPKIEFVYNGHVM